MRSVRYAFGAALALFLSAPAAASPITVTFSGSVAFVEPFFHPTLSPGDTISGSVTYEANVSGNGSVSGAPYGASFTLGPTTHSSSTVSYVINPTLCGLPGTCAVLSISTPIGVELEHVTSLYFQFAIFPTPGFPTSPLPGPEDLAQAANIYVFDQDFLDGSPNSVRLIAEITSISFVPEPAGLTLLAGALVALSALRRRAA